MKSKPPAAVISGFCNPSNPPDSHARCRKHDCPCFCHWIPDPPKEPDVLDSTTVPTHRERPGAAPVPATVAEGREAVRDTRAALDTPTGVIVTDAAPETDEWFAARRGGITGTDLPKILGLSKYGNALSVWLDKRGELDDEAGEAARWGQLLEDVVAQEWAERQQRGTLLRRIGVVMHHERQWIRASLDRVVIECPDDHGLKVCGLEVKTRSAFKADEWRDGIPDDVLAQTTWGLLATGYHHMHVAALIGGQRLASFRVDRDEKLITYLLDAAEPVWQAVEAGTPPDVHPDADGVLLELLDRLYEKRAGARELDIEAAERWLEQYAQGGDLENEGKRLKTQAKTALVQLLDDGDTGLVDGVPRFTYKRPDPGIAMPADEVKRLQAERPDTFAELKADGYVVDTAPGPRFNLKKTSAKETD